MNIDALGRQLLVAALTYYVFNEDSGMSDSEYDEKSKIVADNWDQLLLERQICMGKPEEIRMTGYHFLFTTLCVHSALRQWNWKRLLPCEPEWKSHPHLGRYITTSQTIQLVDA